MPFIGNQPAVKYTSFAQQSFSIVNSQTEYTLDHAVANGQEILLYINNVKQVEGSSNAYTASGTTLTLSSALTNGTDTMYCLFIGKAIQTVNPPQGSVDTAQLVDSAVSTAKIADSAITSAKLASGAVANTPAFHVNLNGTGVSCASGSNTKVTYTNRVFDTDNAFDITTNNRFVVPTGKAGKYFFYAQARMGSSLDATRYLSSLRKNGTTVCEMNNNNIDEDTVVSTIILDLAAGDYVEQFIFHNIGSTKSIEGSAIRTYFTGYRLIG